jgi:hypothetical protein
VRIVATGLAFVVAVGIAADTAAAKPRKSTCKLTAPPASVASGMTLSFTGKLAPKAKRKVSLQTRSGRKWVTQATGNSSRRGAFKLTVKLDNAGAAKWRVSATKTSKYKSATCSSVTITVTTGTNTGSGTGGMMNGDMPGGTPGSGGPPTPPPADAPKPAYRAIYAVASDEMPVADRPAAIAVDIKAVDEWFATQTTGNVQPRWVRGSGGDPIVTTVMLPNPTSYYNGPDAFAHVRADVAAASPAGATQKTVVWIEGGMMIQGCGITGSDYSILFGAVCGIHPAAGDTWPFGGTYLLAHEMTHNFGAVPDCAPHEGNGHHVTDDSRDVLYQGPNPRDWFNQMLDPGHDDYYATGRADCMGIESSNWWTATSNPAS